MFRNGVPQWRFDKSNLIGFVIRKDNGSNNSLFLSYQMGLSDGAFFMIKYAPLPNRNYPISSPICPMGVADTLRLSAVAFNIYYIFNQSQNSTPVEIVSALSFDWWRDQ